MGSLSNIVFYLFVISTSASHPRNSDKHHSRPKRFNPFHSIDNLPGHLGLSVGTLNSSHSLETTNKSHPPRTINKPRRFPLPFISYGTSHVPQPSPSSYLQLFQPHWYLLPPFRHPFHLFLPSAPLSMWGLMMKRCLRFLPWYFGRPSWMSCNFLCHFSCLVLGRIQRYLR